MPTELAGEAILVPHGVSLRIRVLSVGIICVLTAAVTCHVSAPFLAAPAEVREAFHNKYALGGHAVSRPELDRFRRWEFHFSRHGKRLRADFLNDGTWWQTETTLKVDTMPIVVLRNLDRWFKAKWGRELSVADIRKIEQVWEPKDREFPGLGERTYIEVKIDPPGDQSKLSVQFSLNGELISERSP